MEDMKLPFAKSIYSALSTLLCGGPPRVSGGFFPVLSDGIRH